MQIGPRTHEMESHVQHCWRRQINGRTYSFVHVKVSRLGHPWISVIREEPDGTGARVRCTCRRTDCDIADRLDVAPVAQADGRVTGFGRDADSEELRRTLPGRGTITVRQLQEYL
jgi:hypothetical protein